MSYDSSKIHYKELNVLVNLIPENRRLIKYPLYDFHLIDVKSASDGYRLEIKDTDQFDDSISEFGSLRGEVPNYNDFRSAMMSSGILKIANLDQVKEEIKRYEKAKSGVRFALDTNMLYHNFVRNHTFIDPKDVILVETVKEELKNVLNKKYSKKDIQALKGYAPKFRELLDELGNRRIKKSRKASLAHRDWQYLIDNDARVIETVRESSSKEGESDKIIVESLKEHDDKISQFVVLLTADDALIDLCKMENMEYIKCDMEHQVDSTNCDYKQLRNLLYDMANMFGFIKFGPVIIYGVYRGYTSNKPDVLKVKTQNNKLHDELEEELETCRKLKELEIEQ
ncbi:MAG: PIN domain-containing protein [Thermoplasmatota archaeon]